MRDFLLVCCYLSRCRFYIISTWVRDEHVVQYNRYISFGILDIDMLSKITGELC